MAKKPKFDKQQIVITPRGEAVFPWLTKPDTKFNEGGVFKTGLRLDPKDAAVKKFLKNLKSIIDEAKAKCEAEGIEDFEVADLVERETDDDGKATGFVILKAKSYATQTTNDGETVQITLDIVDAKRNKLPKGKAVYGGSELKLAVRPSVYLMPAQKRGKTVIPAQLGLTLYISGVQVLKLVTGGGGAANLFDDEEGFEVEDNDGGADESFADEDGDEDEDEDEDDLY